MIRLVWSSAKHALRALLYALAGGFVMAIVFLVMHLNNRPDLKVWHTARLKQEFTEDSDVSSFAEYLALEDRLFAELDEKVYERIAPEDRRGFVRYNRGSRADPSRWPRNWNRSFLFEAESPRLSALLIHGMSDSPYSMRSLAERLHASGASVIGLRVPGHGTAPSGLVRVEWEDMAAAVRLAATHASELAPGRPLVMVGYSNGGALAVEYTLVALDDDSLPLPAQLVLLSPEIGITRLAGLAVWQERLGHLLGLEKLAWNSLLPEYDPYKYGSFALNAGKQAHLITKDIQTRISQLAETGDLERFPPTLAFQSVVDATVTAPVLVSGLMNRLPGEQNELVLFGINRNASIEMLLKRDPDAWLDDMLLGARSPFTISHLSNASEESQDIVLRQRLRGQDAISRRPLDLRWPDDVYSLSHVALPFPPDDPVYGGPAADRTVGITLGALALRGERAVLVLSASEMLRLRWNPFHSYIDERLDKIVDTLAPPQP